MENIVIQITKTSANDKKRVGTIRQYKEKIERKQFYDHYDIYKKYVTQEEKDIDNAIRNLDNMLKTIEKINIQRKGIL